MRVAFDLDGVLADLRTPFVRAALRLFPELEVAAVESGDLLGAAGGAGEPRDDDVPPVLPGVNLSRRQSDAVWRHLANTENFWEGLGEIESGAIAGLAALADERRWEVLFITSRPRSTGRTVQRQSQRWLQAHGFPMPSVYVIHGSRGRVADALALDVVVDDRADNCLDIVLESKAGALLVWRGAMAKVPATAKHLGIAVVPTVAKAIEALVEAERAAGGGSMLDRLRRLFGVKTKTSPLVR